SAIYKASSAVLAWLVIDPKELVISISPVSFKQRSISTLQIYITLTYSCKHVDRLYGKSV
ncbi:MAG TPA: hypothetical protein VK952_07080, partial [Methylotenera sp.]|nr:hypothetical protein [Methylotenera sp.]